MSSVFRHLEKKWKVVVDHAHELSLLSSLYATALYQPSSDEVTIKEFCQDESELVVVYYRWESYSVDCNPLDLREINSFQEDVILDDCVGKEIGKVVDCGVYSPVQTSFREDHVVNSANDVIPGSSFNNTNLFPVEHSLNSIFEKEKEKERWIGLEDHSFAFTNSFSDGPNESILSSSTISTDSSISGFEMDCIHSDPFLPDISLPSHFEVL